MKMNMQLILLVIIVILVFRSGKGGYAAQPDFPQPVIYCDPHVVQVLPIHCQDIRDIMTKTDDIIIYDIFLNYLRSNQDCYSCMAAVNYPNSTTSQIPPFTYSQGTHDIVGQMIQTLILDPINQGQNNPQQPLSCEHLKLYNALIFYDQGSNLYNFNGTYL